VKENKDVVSLDFYDNQLTVIEKDGDAYVPMRPIVEGIGLDWASQSTKLLNNKNKFSCGDITTTGN